MQVTKIEFYRHVRQCEAIVNAGCTTAYNQTTNTTHWYVANTEIGRSNGPLGEATEYEAL
jgi:hypothetical protein